MCCNGIEHDRMHVKLHASCGLYGMASASLPFAPLLTSAASSRVPLALASSLFVRRSWCTHKLPTCYGNIF